MSNPYGRHQLAQYSFSLRYHAYSEPGSSCSDACSIGSAKVSMASVGDTELGTHRVRTMIPFQFGIVFLVVSVTDRLPSFVLDEQALRSESGRRSLLRRPQVKSSHARGTGSSSTQVRSRVWSRSRRRHMGRSFGPSLRSVFWRGLARSPRRSFKLWCRVLYCCTFTSLFRLLSRVRASFPNGHDEELA